MRIFLILTTMAAVGLSAPAQDLKKEITVDRTVQPELRDAYRINGVIPSLISTQVTKKKLNTAEYSSPGKITNEAAQLPPAPWRDSVEITQYKGYASLGYFPAFNLGANAGYRFLATEKANAGAWMQYDGVSYKGHDFNDETLARNYITIGANGLYHINSRSAISLDVDFMHAGIRMPLSVIENGYVYDRHYTQCADRFNADLDWYGVYKNVKLDAAAGFRHFGFGENMPDIPPGLQPVRQNALDLAFGFGVVPDDSPDPWIGAVVDWSVLNSTGITDFNVSPMTYSKATITEGHIRPYLIFGNDENIRGRFGFNLSVATGNDNGHLRIAPDVEINWAPVYFLNLYGKATGGEYLNTESALFEINPYMQPIYAYERSNRAVELEAGANLLTSAGFSMRAFAGFAAGRGRLLPFIEIGINDDITSTFTYANINSWHAGVRADYDFRRLFSLHGSIEAGGSNKDYASWQYWHDGAKCVAEIGVTAKPVEQLNVGVAYNLRTDRKAPCLNAKEYIYGSQVPSPASLCDLGDIGSLNFNADYRINPQITVFASIENMLNKKWQMIGGLPAQGIKGLCGVALKF